MESEAGFTTAMGVALATMVLAYIVIFTELIHRSSAALAGGILMIGVGTWMGFYSQTAAVQAIDANTMFLLISMMMMVVMLRPTGGFEYLAIKIAKASGSDPRRLLVFLCIAVSVISMFLDNVTTVLIFAPLTVLITRLLNINPLPFLMAEAMLSNIGGASTLVGDPPNIMIGSAGNIDFMTFILNMGPIICVVWFCTIGLTLFLFREYLNQPITVELDLDESKAIKDPVALKKTLFALSITIILFFVHHHFHLFPSYVAFIGAAIALVLVQPDPETLYGEMEWSVLVFFAGLFVIVGGVESSGLLDLVGFELADFAKQEDQLLLACILLMWVAAVLSAIVDNIPFTVTMIPIVQGLEAQGVPVLPLWWALAIGVGIGGNGSHIGATANVICVTESERCGIPEARITPMLWLRKGLPMMVFSLIMATIAFSVGFDYLR
ncbi:ArsB/NhaD family transporter [Aestuariirhabdus sp. Z084]|uniref:SLC13 family permease n=1 Tax=Aestuariirhabdus haliotis TaxID=2918751 RepID=UPI00201B3796|nr:ArsB/NhaD family transporter [Aestuariirhabdus haliotis]MCL6415310.1 ArsB/NhaD family transporter [Aestuariirhabdus haliotis]MCL6419570.1 ArsB/NhaD family transporter [Aestuariirhabdus haliotis]